MRSTDNLIRDPVASQSQAGMRDENAKLVLSYIRRHGRMPGAEIARRSGLSAQTVSNILRALETKAIIKRGKTVKGKVGKPSVPMELNPEGVYSLGLNIGRRSAELVLVDFHGTPIASEAISYPYPEVEAVFDFVEAGLERIFAGQAKARDRTTGIGVARPGAIWSWLEEVNAPFEAMEVWKHLDLGDRISRTTGFDVFIENDATTACVAELLLGRGAEFNDFAYIFVGAFVGGGLVLNGKVIWGRTGNNCALGIMPMVDPSGKPTQLLNVGSLHVLEDALGAAGMDPLKLRESPDDWSIFEPFVTTWIEMTAHYLSLAAASMASVVEVEAILIDGAMPVDVKRKLVAATAERVSKLDLSGIERPVMAEGRVGRSARSIGAALLPIHSRYFVA